MARKGKRRKGKTCCSVDQHCAAPAGYSVGGRCGPNDTLPTKLPKCDGCGGDVCRNCSYTRKDERFCTECFIDKFGKSAEITVVARRYRLAGYDNSRAIAKKEVGQGSTGVL